MEKRITVVGDRPNARRKSDSACAGLLESAERARFAQLEKGLQEKFARDRAEAMADDDGVPAILG